MLIELEILSKVAVALSILMLTVYGKKLRKKNDRHRKMQK